MFPTEFESSTSLLSPISPVHKYLIALSLLVTILPLGAREIMSVNRINLLNGIDVGEILFQ
jgi:hypothetical protein